MMRCQTVLALCGVSLVVLLLSACGKHDAATPETPATSASAAATLTPAQATTAVTPAIAATAQLVPAPVGSIAPATAASAAAAATPAAGLSLDKLVLGDAVDDNHKVTHPGSRFDSDDKTLYACVITAGKSGGATLNAKWSYLEGDTQLVSSISQSIATDGPAVTTFKVHNPDLWPEGKYRVEISLDGKSVAKQDFTIGKS